MSGDKFNYFLKVIMNASLDDYTSISEQIENDMSLSDAEMAELERLINTYMSIYNKGTVRIVNSTTGKEEEPPGIKEDDFGGTSRFEGEVYVYGMKWKVYVPADGFGRDGSQRWYYNERICGILNDLLHEVVPGKSRNYFDIPPWVMGTGQSPDTRYVPVTELVNIAISKKYIPGWDFLVEMGIPKAYVNVLRTNDLGSIT